ncbi:BTB domain-containing protein [Mycena indigotica]|uniref:BTB domain-containing protein n=1 Tax=Mycena indigotica TaxID=2126181 RepID=A0A8H6S3V7_9AGAR|nr:BTB domain-containing protein [Mycena indigotica]KAF7292243.1 BTB domain-containing protein [Mycena indigotica]
MADRPLRWLSLTPPAVEASIQRASGSLSGIWLGGELAGGGRLQLRDGRPLSSPARYGPFVACRRHVVFGDKNAPRLAFMKIPFTSLALSPSFGQLHPHPLAWPLVVGCSRAPALRHPRFYFDDGRIVPRVRDTLYKVHRFVLAPEGENTTFSWRLENEAATEFVPLVLHDDDADSLNAFLGLKYETPSPKFDNARTITDLPTLIQANKFARAHDIWRTAQWIAGLISRILSTLGDDPEALLNDRISFPHCLTLLRSLRELRLALSRFASWGRQPRAASASSRSRSRAIRGRRHGFPPPGARHGA